jgi:hypothetical protein
MEQPTSNAGNLVGTWQLVSIQFEFADTGEYVDVYGANPLGFLILTEDQRLMAIVTSSGRVPPEPRPTVRRSSRA